MADKPFFDEAELKELGIVIKDSDARATKLSELNDVHTTRVGQELIKHLSEKQIDEFEQMLDSNASDELQLGWLKKSYSGYEEVVNDVYKQIKDELKHGRI